MERITSVKNPLVASVRHLKNRANRLEAGAFVVEGTKMAREALARKEAPLSLWLSDDCGGEAMELADMATCQTYSVPPHVMSALCDTKTPQGIACVVALPQAPTLEALQDKLIVLDDVQDPGNVGTILRTADAAGFSGAILSLGSADPYSGKCLRATMGSIFRLPVLIAEDLPRVLTALRARGAEVIAAELGGDGFFERQAIGPPFALVIGNEGNGISKAVSQTATRHLALPMAGGAESLNAAVAAGIMMYDLAFNTSRAK